MTPSRSRITRRSGEGMGTSLVASLCMLWAPSVARGTRSAKARGERREARGERREARGERREARGERREVRVFHVKHGGVARHEKGRQLGCRPFSSPERRGLLL